ncbi:hypothetical protein NIIDMKKI_15660 [Mycobacterium kansasii]|uniref:Nitrate reductase delta subunit n=1 Tax=Mycobacterium kansasii TaxID=1768 RepID=A0A7G1I5V7_MYCKA|nr:hypothetical protein NIIDMKKI_15660 [Mycobacterium kansasii]
MKLRSRSREPAMRDRLVWQAASLLLAYPDDGLTERLDTVEGLLAHLDGTVADLLGRTVAALRAAEPMAAAMDYVATFDMRRRATMYLTYWTAGIPATAGGKCWPSPPPTGRRVWSRRAARRRITCPWCSSSRRPSHPGRDASC